MGPMSKIEWTDETWNVVTGCTRVSVGCKNCYMYQQYPRLKALGKATGATGYQHNPTDVVLHPQRLQTPLHWRKPRLVFVNSMSDTFHERVPDHFLQWLFQAMLFGAEKGHTFQLLTKRPERALQWWQRHRDDLGGVWPRAIWLGVSVEDQANAQPRLDPLRRIPAPVRFVSAEPLLGPLDLGRWLGEVVQWVIVGGESGPRARPMREEWALQVLEQCDAAGIPAFLKQLGGRRDKRGGDLAVIDGRRWQGMPLAQAAR